MSMVQLVGFSSRRTSIRRVLPSVSMNSGRGNWAARVDFPIPSGP